MRYMINYKPAFDFDKVLDNVFQGNGYAGERKFPVDVIAGQENYRLEAELPGLTEKDVEVKVDGRVLTISSAASEETKNDYLIRERRVAPFARSFVLPKDVDIEKISASFANGILTLVLEKLPEVKPRKIKVKAA